MARPRKSSPKPQIPLTPAVLSWAEAVGEAMGRGMARGFHQAVSRTGVSLAGAPNGPRPRGRPPKAILFPAPPEKRCKTKGCLRAARSKGLCSAHYQADRRRRLAAQ